jgi:hypothetical protein
MVLPADPLTVKARRDALDAAMLMPSVAAVSLFRTTRLLVVATVAGSAEATVKRVKHRANRRQMDITFFI